MTEWTTVTISATWVIVSLIASFCLGAGYAYLAVRVALWKGWMR